MAGEAATLRVTFVKAYPTYVASLLVARGIEVDDVIADAVVEGTSVLDGLLAGLEGTPSGLQHQSPLELFREALGPVDRALRTTGVPPGMAEPGSVSLVAWDTYMLSPASSAALGPEAHDAHLRWGVSKARDMGAIVSTARRPAVVVTCTTHDRQVIEEQITSSGYVVANNASDASFALIDTDADTASADIAYALDMGRRTIVFGDRLDDLERQALRARGVWRIVSRDQALTGLGAVLPSIV